MRNSYAFLGIIILCLLLPLAYLGLQQAKVEVYEQLAPGVATGAETTADVTLAALPEPNSAAGITDIESSLTTDIPAVSAYNPSTKVLTVSGLTAEENRNLTVTYNIEATYLESLPYFSAIITAIFYLLIIGLLCLIVVVVINSFKHGND